MLLATKLPHFGLNPPLIRGAFVVSERGYMTPRSLLAIHRRFGRTYCPHLQNDEQSKQEVHLFVCLAYSSTLKTAALRFSEESG
jgi:hypothetical protein